MLKTQFSSKVDLTPFGNELFIIIYTELGKGQENIVLMAIRYKGN